MNTTNHQTETMKQPIPQTTQEILDSGIEHIKRCYQLMEWDLLRANNRLSILETENAHLREDNANKDRRFDYDVFMMGLFLGASAVAIASWLIFRTHGWAL